MLDVMPAHMACPCVAVSLWEKKNIKKNHMEKDYCKLQSFQEKKLQS
jgi:hypothetical protein